MYVGQGYLHCEDFGIYTTFRVHFMCAHTYMVNNGYSLAWPISSLQWIRSRQQFMYTIAKHGDMKQLMIKSCMHP